MHINKGIALSFDQRLNDKKKLGVCEIQKENKDKKILSTFQIPIFPLNSLTPNANSKLGDLTPKSLDKQKHPITTQFYKHQFNYNLRRKLGHYP